jgi:hypothetical protein
MNSRFKTGCAAAIAALVLAVAGGLGYAAGVAKGKAAVIAGVNDLAWQPYAPGAALEVAPLWGDRAKSGDYGILLKMPPGYIAGMHSHGADSEAVLIQGTWVHTVDGDPSSNRDLTPGAYVFQPGKQDHDDACKGKLDCIVFVHQRGKGDFLPARLAGAHRSLPSPSSSPMRSLTSRE